MTETRFELKTRHINRCEMSVKNSSLLFNSRQEYIYGDKIIMSRSYTRKLYTFN